VKKLNIRQNFLKRGNICRIFLLAKNKGITDNKVRKGQKVSKRQGFHGGAFLNKEHFYQKRSLYECIGE